MNNRKEVYKMNILNNDKYVNIRSTMIIMGESEISTSTINNIGYKLIIPKDELQNSEMLRNIYYEFNEEDVSITISESKVCFKVMYNRPIPILTLPALSISKGYGIRVARYITSTFGINECEVVNLYCYEDVSMEDI